MDTRATALIRELGLERHPEGGHYRQTFKSVAIVEPGDGRRERSALTAIDFLLAEGECSRWHRVASDEVWTHLEGSVIRLWLFDGVTARAQNLGPLAGGAAPVIVVPAGVWQAAELAGDYALAACFVAPGFEFEDFVMMSDAGAADARAALESVDRALLRLV